MSALNLTLLDGLFAKCGYRALACHKTVRYLITTPFLTKYRLKRSADTLHRLVLGYDVSRLAVCLGQISHRPFRC